MLCVYNRTLFSNSINSSNSDVIVTLKEAEKFQFRSLESAWNEWFNVHQRTLSLHLVSRCQVGGSLCCLCIVHILSSLWAGMNYSWGIWVSQNLTTERGTSWGPAEENKARYVGLRRLSGRSVKDYGNLCLCWTGSWFHSELMLVWLQVLLNSTSSMLRFYAEVRTSSSPQGMW